jgi:murein DD-endopeptidase
MTLEQCMAVSALLAATGASAVRAQELSPTPVEVTVPTPPTPVRSLGRTHLVYEVHLTNFGRSPLTLRQLAVLAADRSDASIAAWDGTSLAQRLAVLGRAPSAAGPTRELPAGGRAIAFIWLTLPNGVDSVSLLRHRVVFDGADGRADTLTADTVRARPPWSAAIAAPVDDGPWVAVRGPSGSSAHRLSVVALHGRARVPQRFAIDWVKLGDDGRLFRGDSTANRSWHGYGAPVRSVAPGTVVLVRDGVSDNVPLSGVMAVTVDATSATGNTVVVDLGDRRYATYAHLRPGSLKVKHGDTVVAGQLLGDVGNSGNSLAPHLHFQIGDSVEPLAGEGLPFALGPFTLLGRLPSLAAALAGAAWNPVASQPSRAVSNEMPLEDMIVRFPRP